MERQTVQEVYSYDKDFHKIPNIVRVLNETIKW